MPIPKEAEFAYGLLGGEITTHYRWDPDLRQVEGALIELGGYLDDIYEPLHGSQEVLKADIQKRFDTETWPDGTPWRRLSYSYGQWKAKHYPSQTILRLHGPLEKAATSDSAFIVNEQNGQIFYSAANLPHYWELHQYGSEGFSDLLSRREMKRLRLDTEEDLGKIDPGSNVPPRPFIGVSTEAEQLIFDVFDLWFYKGVHETVQFIEDLPTRSPYMSPSGESYFNKSKFYIRKGGTVQSRVSGPGFGGRFGPKVAKIDLL